MTSPRDFERIPPRKGKYERLHDIANAHTQLRILARFIRQKHRFEEPDASAIADRLERTAAALLDELTRLRLEWGKPTHEDET
jgi:hypothetical protein